MDEDAAADQPRVRDVLDVSSSEQAHRPDPYERPMLRPCERISPEAAGGISVSLEERFQALTKPLPLSGAEVMRTVGADAIMLCESLRSRMPWMETAIATIERQLRLALWAGRPWLSWRPLCLVGPPGSGKSYFAREIARIARIGHAALDLGAMHDAGALVSVSRGWTNTKPCWPAEMMNSLGCANPILVIDELEKAGGSRRNGDPQLALLAMLERSTAVAYFDTCLMADVDLSAVCWIATANSLVRIPGPLLSRVEVVHVGGPEAEDFDLVEGNLILDLAERWQISPESVPELPNDVRAVLRASFAKHRSVRMMKRHIEDVVATLVQGGDKRFH